MPKLIVTADLHGHLNAWMTIKVLLEKDDSLAVAGDLFDTRYGSFSSPDYDPQEIKNDLNAFSHPYFYVYGNCDVASFFPGHDQELAYEFQGHHIRMGHGHKPIRPLPETKIIIQGHTHIARLESRNNIIYLNPGSLAVPRNGIFTYGIIDKTTVYLVELKSGQSLISLPLPH